MVEFLWYFFIAAAAIQLIFNLLATLSLALHKDLPDTGGNDIDVSVVISAKNECFNLKKLLPILYRQDHQDFEIIVVDDNSSDETYDFLLAESKKNDRLRFVHVNSTPHHINEKKYALTLGIRSAKKEVILLTDADCWPESDHWINLMTTPFAKKKTDIVLGYSQYEKRTGFLNAFIKYETLLTGLTYITFALLRRPYMGVGRNLAYRKEIFLENNGFGRYQKITGGDDDLFVMEHANIRNTKVVIQKDVLVTSVPKTNWHSYYLQKKRHLSVGKHYRFTDKMLLGILFISKLSFWLCFFAAIMSGFKPYITAGCFILTLVSLLVSMHTLKRKTGDNFTLWMLPFLDITYLFHYITSGLGVLFTKKVKWN